MNFFTQLRGRFFGTGVALPSAGMYHYRKETPTGNARMHLRLEADGDSLLLVNANRAFHLNPTAARMAYLNLQGISDDQAVRVLCDWFKAPADQIRQDYADLSAQLNVITDPEEHCALCELDLETTMPFSSTLTAPYRMDLALTYRCNNECAHCYNARSRQYPELSTQQWKDNLDRLWEIGVPHIIFTGGEPTLRADLPELIAHAEKNGQMTGLNTNGRRLKNGAFLQSLVDAGLDHVQITLESHDAAIHDRMVASPGAWEDTVAGIRNALAARLYVMTNTTLLTTNHATLLETLDFLAAVGVPTVGLNALIYSGHGAQVGAGLPESALPGLLVAAREKTETAGQRLIWYTPTSYCHFNPLDLDLGIKGCTAARYAMCVEPDGAVLPCQSYYQPLGYLQNDPWQSIWNHPLALSLREHRDILPACNSCDLLNTCYGGCPLSRQANPDQTPKPVSAPLFASREVL
jgi:radical SAM protein with 4Fe4S-binding SPASM domain